MDPPVRIDNNNNQHHDIIIGDPPAGGSHISSPSTRHWDMCGQRLPKSEIVYFVQVILVYVVVIVSIVNLTLGRSDEKLWIALLSSSIGYILPNPI